MDKSYKSFWMKDEDQQGDYSNGKIDTFNPTKGYIGVRLQQGVPLLDRDWNELEDIRRYQEMTFRKSYIGDCSPDDGFMIEALDPPGNDFKIKKGRYLIDGFDIENSADINFSSQPDRDPTALSTPTHPRTDAVYLQVRITEINSTGTDADPDLGNPDDVNRSTCLRHKLKWAVRVAEDRETEPQSDRLIHCSLLATIARNGSTILPGEITDKRSKRRTLLPVGIICMWSGAKDIPKGWELCDGHRSGIPNLRSLFIVGAEANANIELCFIIYTGKDT